MVSESSSRTTTPTHTENTSMLTACEAGQGMRGGESLQPEVRSFGQWASVSVHLTASPILRDLSLVPVDNSSSFPAPHRVFSPDEAGSQDLWAGKTQTSTVILGTHAV